MHSMDLFFSSNNSSTLPIHTDHILLTGRSIQRPSLEHVLPPHPHPLRAKPALLPQHAPPIWPLLHRTGCRLPSRDPLRRPLGRPHRKEVHPHTRRARGRRSSAELSPLHWDRYPGVHAGVWVECREEGWRRGFTSCDDVFAGRSAVVLFSELEYLLS